MLKKNEAKINELAGKIKCLPTLNALPRKSSGTGASMTPPNGRTFNTAAKNNIKKIILDVFNNVQFKTFEAHLYPVRFIKIFKVYEKIMEKFPLLKPFLAYNSTIIKND